MAAVSPTKEKSTDTYRVWSAVIDGADTVNIPLGGGCRIAYLWTREDDLRIAAVAQNTILGTEDELVLDMDDGTPLQAEVIGFFRTPSPIQMGWIVDPPAEIQISTQGAATDNVLVVVEAHYTLTRPRGRGR